MELNLYTAIMVFVRASAFLVVLPFFSATNFPVRLRIALGICIAILIAPTIQPFAVRHLDYFSLVSAMVKEVAIGLMLGFVSRMVFYAVDFAGSIISNELGLNMGSIMDPLNQTPSPVLGTVLFFMAAIVMLTLDLHHWVLLGFQRTYDVLPIGVAHVNSALFDTLLDQTAHILSVGLQIAAPIMAVSFVVTVVFAVLARAVPQMNVFVLSGSFRVVAGLTVFGFTLQLTAQYVINYLNRLPDDLLRVAQLLGVR